MIEQLLGHIKELLELSWCLQLHLLPYVLLLEELEEDRVLCLHLHLLFWGPIAMSKDPYYRSQLPLEIALVELIWSILSLGAFCADIVFDWVYQSVQIVMGPSELVVDDPSDLRSAILVVLL